MEGQRDRCFKESWSDGGASAPNTSRTPQPPPPNLMEEAQRILRQLPG